MGICFTFPLTPPPSLPASDPLNKPIPKTPLHSFSPSFQPLNGFLEGNIYSIYRKHEVHPPQQPIIFYGFRHVFPRTSLFLKEPCKLCQPLFLQPAHGKHQTTYSYRSCSWGSPAHVGVLGIAQHALVSTLAGHRFCSFRSEDRSSGRSPVPWGRGKRHPQRNDTPENSHRP